MTGEEWMINRPGAYLPDVYEEVRKWFTIQNIIDAFPPRTQCRDFDDFKYQKRKKRLKLQCTKILIIVCTDGKF